MKFVEFRAVTGDKMYVESSYIAAVFVLRSLTTMQTTTMLRLKCGGVYELSTPIETVMKLIEGE